MTHPREIDLKKQVFDLQEELDLEREIRAIYHKAINDIAVRTGEEKTLRTIKEAWNKVSDLTLKAREKKWR